MFGLKIEMKRERESEEKTGVNVPVIESRGNWRIRWFRTGTRRVCKKGVTLISIRVHFHQENSRAGTNMANMEA